MSTPLNTPQMARKSPVDIPCADRLQLSGNLYTPDGQPKAAVFIGPATGIKKTFYHAFATYLCENGYGVLCFENRGIGQSHGSRLNEVDASLINWGRLDMPAALRVLQTEFPGTTYHLIGHSAGGQLLGLMDNALEIDSLFNVAASSGSLQNMRYPYKAIAAFFLNLFIPLSNSLFGQTNSQWVGMGEPLPKMVAAQWSRWCNGRGYVATDLGGEIGQHLYGEITLPSKWVHATDDNIASLENVKDMIRVFPRISADIVSLKPSDWGLKEIGHMKYFSSRCKHLWPMALEWLDTQRSARNSPK